MTFELRRPVICLVTDRRRLRDATGDRLLHLVDRAVHAGVNLVQVRERDLPDAALLTLVRRMVDVSYGSGAALVINDRVDIALAAGASGVHLRADSMSAARVRAMVPPGFLIGRSVHSAQDASAAEPSGVDYLVLGTVFPSSSKGAGAPLAGTAGLRAACEAVRVPVLAIGGVTCDNVGEAAAAGAHGIAAIGLFAGVQDSSAGEMSVGLRRIVDRIHDAFTRAMSTPQAHG